MRETTSSGAAASPSASPFPSPTLAEVEADGEPVALLEAQTSLFGETRRRHGDRDVPDGVPLKIRPFPARRRRSRRLGRLILDTTRINEAELAAAASEARTRDAIIETIPQAVVLDDSNDLLVTWNTRFLALYPQLADQIVTGRAHVEIVRAELQRGIDPLSEGVDPEFRLYERLTQHHLAN